jgi:hypothetical protein
MKPKTMKDIFELRAEAAEADDMETVALCDDAIYGKTRAIAQCLAIMGAADAMHDDDCEGWDYE